MSDSNSYFSNGKILAIAAGLLLSAALTLVPLVAQSGDPASGEPVSAAATSEPPPKEPPPEAERTSSGLASMVLSPGGGTYHPDPNDQVVAHFVIWTPAGGKVQSSYDLGKPGQFDLQQVFPGWREGLQLMVSGEKRRLWIPPHLAPKSPQGGPPGAVIIDVEIMGILKIPNLHADFRQPPADAERTDHGAFTKILQAGQGDKNPAADESVVVVFTGWDPSGRVFSSSIQRGRPTMFILDRVMPAFSDCVQRMVIGEERMCWVPGHVAAGQWPEAPDGMLIFEVKLMQIFEAGLVQVEKQKPDGSSPQPPKP